MVIRRPENCVPLAHPRYAPDHKCIDGWMFILDLDQLYGFSSTTITNIYLSLILH